MYTYTHIYIYIYIYVYIYTYITITILLVQSYCCLLSVFISGPARPTTPPLVTTFLWMNWMMTSSSCMLTYVDLVFSHPFSKHYSCNFPGLYFSFPYGVPRSLEMQCVAYCLHRTAEGTVFAPSEFRLEG